MNIIQKIVEKYSGEYIEFDEKVFHTPEGKYVTQLQEGKVTIGKRKFAISQNKSIGINFNVGKSDSLFNEPMHLFLYLDKNERKLNIYPKTKFQKAISFIAHPKTINHFVFKGENYLINQLEQDHGLKDNLKNENIYISINEKYPNKIMLTPKNGIKNISTFEKYTAILNVIADKINTANTP